MRSDITERPTGHFQPKTLREVFVLQLAQRFDDEANLPRYLDLLGTHTLPVLLDIFAIAKEETTTPEALRERFWSILHEQQDGKENA
jgi:hypothetical protein